MTSFTAVFGAETLLPSNFNYLALAIAASITMKWPLEQQTGGTDVVASVVDVTAAAPGLNIVMPDATLVSNGTSVLFNNVGAQTVTIQDAAGGTILSMPAGSAWQIYLRANTTSAGLWRAFQFGASVSVANAAALAGAGLKAIGSTLNTRIPTSSKAVNYVIVNSDRAVALIWTGGVGTYTLPTAATVGSDWYTIVKNSGSGDLVVSPPSGTIDGAASKTYPAGSSSFIVTDGANYFTIGFGSGSSGGGGGFAFITIAVPGSGNYVLSGAELDQVGYRFTGILTGTRNIVVPGSVDEYWVDNQTTGAFSLFVKTVAQVPGVQILQNNRNILYCDGTNVIAAESATVTFPIPVAQGGTGSITASAARTALGSGGVGDSIFVATTQALAQTALGITLAGGNTWTASNTFTGTSGTGAIQLSSTAPILCWNETDGAVDNKAWRQYASNEAFEFDAVNDAFSAATVWLHVDRTGITIDTVNFLNGVLQYGSQEVGYRDLIRRDFGGSTNIAVTDRGRAVRYTGGGGDTLSVPAATISSNGIVTVINAGSGNLNLAGSGGTTLNWYNGSGSPVSGSRVIAGGSFVTLYWESGSSVNVAGNGIS